MSHTRVLFLGDSITDNGTYLAYLETLRLVEPRLEGFDLINLWVNGENTSGRFEPDLPGPRPNVHSRLGRALQLAQPNWAVVCYGMNDGVFSPGSAATTVAFRTGMTRLLEGLQGLERVVVLTPPPFQTARVPRECRPLDRPPHGYMTPYTGYDEVLGGFASWLVEVCPRFGVEVLDLHSRLTSEDYVADDGVHPGLAGHEQIAAHLLGLWGVQRSRPLLGSLPRASEVLDLMTKRHRLLSAAWKEAVGHDNPVKVDALPLDEAQKRAEELERRAREVLLMTANPPGRPGDSSHTSRGKRG